MRRVAFASAFVATLAAVASAGCTFNGNAFNIPTTTLPIAQSVPENPGLDGMRQWQLALCTPATYSGCPSTPASYVIEINGNGDGCDVGFNTATTEAWVSNYGGAQNTFTGTAAMANDRVANVTLICDPSATTPTNEGDVIAYSSSGGTVWNFNIRIKTNQVCGGNPPPVPTPQPAGPPATPTPGAPPLTPNPVGPTPPGEAPKKEEAKTSWVAILFVVLVFVIPITYVVAFMVYNYVKLGKRGVKELLPHPDFWKDFPVLCLDGCKFVKNKFMQLIGKGDGTGTYGGGGEASYTKV